MGEYRPPEIFVDEQFIRTTVERELPDFARMCYDVEHGKADAAIMQQDAFASGYSFPELLLLGLAIKYAGFFNVPIYIHGLNHSTFD
jgi:hypothetical protein